MYKVAIIGSGNWGTAIARRIARNVGEKKTLEIDRTDSSSFNSTVKMWVYEEIVHGGRNLSEVINTNHENPKYLPGIALPTNILADPDLLSTCSDADILVFVVPHQFLPRILAQMKGRVKRDAIAVSLIKGLCVKEGGPELLSEMIERELGLSHENVAVLMGANVAAEVAEDHFVESTLACRDKSTADILKSLFYAQQFRVQVCHDVATVELCAALKNVVAMGAGFSDAMKNGPSTKAAVIRKGLEEMGKFCARYSPTYDSSTLFHSCGVADLIATCFGGRNRKCAEEFARRSLHWARETGGGSDIGTVITSDEEMKLRKVWDDIEEELLGGQKLQGILTLDEIHQCLENGGKEGGSSPFQNFPLFKRIYDIARKGASPTTLFEWDDEE